MKRTCHSSSLFLLVILVNTATGSRWGHSSSVPASFRRSHLPNTSVQHHHAYCHILKSVNRYRAGELDATSPEELDATSPGEDVAATEIATPNETMAKENDVSTEISAMEKRGLLVVQLSSLLSMLSTTVVAFAPAPVLVKKLGSAKATSLLSILAASSAVVEILFSPSVGRFMDVCGRKRPLLAVLGAISISQLTVVLSNGSTWSICLGKFAGTLGIGLFFQTIGQAIMTDVTGRGSSPERLSSALGMQASLISIAFLVGALSAGKIQSAFGLTMSYGIAATLALANVVLVAVAMPETLESSVEIQLSPRKSILRSLLSCVDILINRRDGIPVLAAIFALQSLPQFMGDFFQIYCKAEWNLEAGAFSQFVAVFGILGLVSNILGSILVRRLGIRQFTIMTTFLGIIPSICVSIWGLQGMLAGYVFGFLGLAQNLGIMSALVSEGKKQGIPIGELTGERAALMGLVKISAPLIYSTLYIQGKRLLDIPSSPFIFNVLLGAVVFSLSCYHVK